MKKVIIMAWIGCIHGVFFSATDGSVSLQVAKDSAGVTTSVVGSIQFSSDLYVQKIEAFKGRIATLQSEEACDALIKEIRVLGSELNELGKKYSVQGDKNGVRQIQGLLGELSKVFKEVQAVYTSFINKAWDVYKSVRANLEVITADSKNIMTSDQMDAINSRILKEKESLITIQNVTIQNLKNAVMQLIQYCDNLLVSLKSRFEVDLVLKQIKSSVDASYVQFAGGVVVATGSLLDSLQSKHLFLQEMQQKYPDKQKMIQGYDKYIMQIATSMQKMKQQWEKISGTVDVQAVASSAASTTGSARFEAVKATLREVAPQVITLKDVAACDAMVQQLDLLRQSFIQDQSLSEAEKKELASQITLLLQNIEQRKLVVTTAA